MQEQVEQLYCSYSFIQSYITILKEISLVLTFFPIFLFELFVYLAVLCLLTFKCFLFPDQMRRRPFVGLWLSTPGLVLMWATPSENGGTVFLHAVSQLSCHEDNTWHKLCSLSCDMFVFQRTDVRKVLSTETVSAAALQHALLRRSAWAPIYTVWMDATAQMVR